MVENSRDQAGWGENQSRSQPGKSQQDAAKAEQGKADPNEKKIPEQKTEYGQNEQGQSDMGGGSADYPGVKLGSRGSSEERMHRDLGKDEMEQQEEENRRGKDRGRDETSGVL